MPFSQGQENMDTTTQEDILHSLNYAHTQNTCFKYSITYIFFFKQICNDYYWTVALCGLEIFCVQKHLISGKGFSENKILKVQAYWTTLEQIIEHLELKEKSIVIQFMALILKGHWVLSDLIHPWSNSKPADNTRWMLLFRYSVCPFPIDSSQWPQTYWWNHTGFL